MQENKDELSRQIVERLVALPEFAAARAVLIYLDVRSEVRTRHALPDLLLQDKRIVVPWCENDRLRLFHLQAACELDRGAFAILEPRGDLRERPERIVEPAELDLIVVPGVAFDRRGGRLGHGMGYFDRLLAEARPDATLVGLAFECQLFDQVPLEAHDVRLDFIITESGIYRGQGRQPRI